MLGRSNFPARILQLQGTIIGQESITKEWGRESCCRAVWMRACFARATCCGAAMRSRHSSIRDGRRSARAVRVLIVARPATASAHASQAGRSWRASSCVIRSCPSAHYLCHRGWRRFDFRAGLILLVGISASRWLFGRGQSSRRCRPKSAIARSCLWPAGPDEDEVAADDPLAARKSRPASLPLAATERPLHTPRPPHAHFRP